MTLNTSVFLPYTADISGVFNKALRSLLRMAGDHDHPTIQIAVEQGRVLTEVGQGLPAWTWLHHDSKGFKDLPKDFLKKGAKPGSLGVRIDFDTGYGAMFDFPGTNIEPFGCAQLHGLVIRNLAETMDLWWVNEFTGEGFHGADGLEEFMKLSSAELEDLYWQVRRACPKVDFIAV